MKRNNKKVKRDVLLLYFRRRRIRTALETRWWTLENKRKELYKLVEYAKIQSRYCMIWTATALSADTSENWSERRYVLPDFRPNTTFGHPVWATGLTSMRRR